MSQDAPGTDTPVPVPAADDQSSAALRRYEATLRRPRLVYAAVVGAVVAVLLVVTVAAWSSGESNNSTLRTTATPPADVALASPVAAPTRNWQAAGRAAQGQPLFGGTVIVGDRRGVRGIEARTGRTTWSYTRSDRTVCTTMQLGGVAIAAFRLDGNCDQLAAFDARTGARKWTRTLDFDGQPIFGTPTFATSAQGTFGSILIRTPSVIYSIDSGSGFNRWTYSRFGCRITGAALGSAGALISQTCTSALRCGSGEEHCRTGQQLLLRDAYQGRDTKVAPMNPDRINWDLRIDAVPVSAGPLVSAVDTSGQLLQFNSADGSTVARTTLSPVPSRPFAVTAADSGDAEIISIGTATLAVRSGTAEPLWRRAGSAAATVVPRSPQETPTLGTARITVPSGGSAVTVDGATGGVTSTVPLPGATSGALVYPLGQGFLVAGTATVAGYV